MRSPTSRRPWGSSAADVSAPVRARATRWVKWAYGITYLLLVLGMIANPAAGAYGGAVIGTVILGVTLGLAYVMSAVWLRSRGRKVREMTSGMAVLLSLPVVLLVIVAGSCVATGLPIPRFG